MDKKALGAFAREAEKSIKTESDLDDFRKILTKMIKILLNQALSLEMGIHPNH